MEPIELGQESRREQKRAEHKRRQTEKHSHPGVECAFFTLTCLLLVKGSPYREISSFQFNSLVSLLFA